MLQTLLVDDDILSLNKLQTFLADLGFIHVDIIILDMEMPGASGI